MKRRILYIGHAFHLRTRSNRFMLDILEKAFDVTLVYVDPDKLHETNFDVSAADYDIAVVYQLDFLAPIFLAKGLPTVVIPMFDGSEHMPEGHWQMANQARFVAFSRHLHVKIQRAGGTSLLVKYFPKVSPNPVRRMNSLNGFFWERRPDSPINTQMIARVIGSQLDKLHIHQAPDIPWTTETALPAQFGNTEITTSQWFENVSELDDIMSQSNVYFAPRLSEGIGMGFLEAMASGMMVIAHDASTHNEYIANWQSGILYTLGIDGSPHVSPELAYELGMNGRQSVAEGRAAWLAQIPEMIDWIETTPAPDIAEVNASMLANEIPKAYLAGFGSYLQFLRRSTPLIHKMSPALDEKRSLAQRPATFPDDDEAGLVPRLSKTVMGFGTSETRPYLVSGWSHDEAGFVWMDGTVGVIRFANSAELSTSTCMTVTCHAPQSIVGQKLAVVLNGSLCGSIDVGDATQSTTFPLPDEGLRKFNEIRLFAGQALTGGADPRALSVAITSIIFE
ncbi:hypothetical protein KOAAANKH_01309 [Brevundimonas sp. NIBR10]|nr:hypothetical protein KOAAANKH_01309 [Brevundimonas sp. NIBR10]